MPKVNVSTSPIRAFGKDALNYIPSLVIPAIVGFFAIGAYTRLLDPKQYGQYILVVTTISIVSSAAFSWLNQAGIRFFYEYKKRGLSRQFISTSFISLFALLTVILFIWYTLTIILYELGHPDLIWLIQIGGVVLGIETVYGFIRVLLRADRKSLKYGLYTALNSLGTFFVAVYLIKYSKLGPEGILLSMIFFSGGIVFIELTGLLRDHLIKVFGYSTDLLKRFASYGIPMVGVSIGALAVSVSDRYMLQYFLGTETVGIYSAGYNLATRSIQGISNILMLAAFPVIVNTFTKKGEQETSIFITKLINIYFIVLVPVLFGLTALSRDIVGIILGKSFQDAYIIFPWVAGGIFCQELSLYSGLTFKLKEKTRFLFWIYVLAAAINIILNIFWIPRFDILGAAYATLIAYIFCLASTWSIGTRILYFVFPWQTLWKTVLAGIIMVIILKVVFPNVAAGILSLISKIVIGAFVYFIMLGILKDGTFLNVLKSGINSLKAISMEFSKKKIDGGE